MVMSAVSSVRTPGVLVTVMPRSTAVATSMLSTPLPKLAISLSWSPALPSTASSMRSVTVGTSTSAVFTASTSSACDIGLSSALSRVSNSSRMRISIVSGSLRVTTTSGFRFGISPPALAPACVQSGIAARLSAARSGLFNRCAPTLHPSFSGACGLRPRPICDGWPRHDKQPRGTRCCRCVTSQFDRLISCRRSRRDRGRLACAADAAAPRGRTGTARPAPSSGLPVPRFVSLKPDKVNVRGGPTRDHDVTWQLHPLRPAGGDHRRIRQLAAHPRLGRLRGLGLSLAAVGPAHRDGDLQVTRTSWFRCSTPPTTRRGGRAPAAGRARLGEALHRRAGARSPAPGSTAGSRRSGCGASIRTRRFRRA